MKNYKAVLINGNRMIIFTLLGCALIMLLFYSTILYEAAEESDERCKARYNIVGSFLGQQFFLNINSWKKHSLYAKYNHFIWTEGNQSMRPFDDGADFTMVHPDDVAKVKALLSSIGDNSDEIDDFVIRFKDRNK